MKKVVAFAMAVLVIGVASGAWAQGLVPEMKFGNDGSLRLNINGFAQGAYSQELGVEPVQSGDVSWKSMRTRLKLTIKDEWEFYTDLNLADFQELNSNWLQEVNVGYRFNENWKLKAGRIFVPAGYTTPAPFMLETVNYPTGDPFRCYAWGAILEGKFGQGWSTMVSLSGNSGLAFSDDNSFDRLELSGRLLKKLEQGAIGVTLQVSQDFCRVGTDFTWKPVSQFYIRFGISYSDIADEKISNCIGGYVIGVYRPVKWFEFHSQLDGTADIQKSYHEYQLTENEGGGIAIDCVDLVTSNQTNAVWTNGIRLFVGKDDMVSFTADYETVVDGIRPNRFLARMQFRF